MRRTALVLALAAPSAAFAGVTPALYEAELAPGDVVTIEKTVTLPEDTPKLDFVLLVDLSGSYYDDLSQIKSRAAGIAADIQAAVPDSQFGLATFVDFPFAPWGMSPDYAYRLDQDLTSDVTTWLSAVNAMSIYYGYDAPESQYEGLYQAASGAGRDINGDGDYADLGDVEPGLNANFRADATKVIAITTDAPFHEGGDYGYSFPYPGATAAETLDALDDAGIKIIAIKAPGASTDMDDLASYTGGSVVYTTSSSSNISSAILSGLETLTYTVSASPSAECDPLVLSYLPDSYAGVSGGESVVFEETIEVPTDISDADLDADGYITCTVDFLADDTVVGTQTIDLYIPLNEPPVALCQDLELEADGTCTADGDVDAGSYDPDGDAITYEYSAEGPFGVGTTAVTLTVTDPSGESDSCVGYVTVSDVTAPTVTTTAVEFWPPNHKYVGFDLADCVVEVTDSCDGAVDIANVGYVTGIYSDEVEDATGNGDGNTTADIVLTGDTSFDLRAERQGASNGRVYGVSFEVSDGAGNATTASCEFSVPHSNNGTPAVNDGASAGYTVY